MIAESLFDHMAATQRELLAASVYGGLVGDECVVDLFCGAGGWGEGAKGLGIGVDYAINHWPVAIETHRVNNPACVHHLGDAWKAKPRAIVGERPVGLLLASAACTTHSRARGSAPISKRVHMLGWCIARWMEEVGPRIVEIENVPEWLGWGPTIVKDGVRVQDPARKGKHFRAWWRYCERLGYAMEMRVLDAPDYGAGSRRKRLFIKCRRDGMPICWPEKSHGKKGNGEQGTGNGQGRGGGAEPRSAGGGPSVAGIPGQRLVHIVDRPAVDEPGNHKHHTAVRVGEDGQGRRTNRAGAAGSGGVSTSGGVLHPFVTAADCIDWSDLGTSIFERPRPLKPKTLARIAEGIRRYVLNDPAPFVLRVTHGEGGGWHVARADEPMRTQTTRQDMAVATPVVQLIRGDSAGGSVKDGLPTITAGNGPGRGAGAAHALGVATPIMARMANGDGAGETKRWGRGAMAVTEEMGTITAGGITCGIATPIMATTGYGEREGQAARVHRVSELLGTAVDGVKQGVVCPVLMNNTTGHTGGRVDGPAPTVTTGGQGAVVAPVMTYMRHGGGQVGRVTEPMGATMAGGTHAVLVAALLLEYYGNTASAKRADGSLGAVTTLDRHGLVVCTIDGQEMVIVDILFRMLRPRELARAMGFEESYVWPKTQRDTVRLIGNAVSPPCARALIGASLPRGRSGNGERGTGTGKKKAVAV